MKRRSSSFKTKEVVGICNAIRKGRVAEERLEDFLCSSLVPSESKLSIHLDMVKFKSHRNRILNGCGYAGLKTIGDLVEKTERDILCMKNFGQNTLLEIKSTLLRYGLFLGTKKCNFLRDEWIKC